MSFGHLHIHNEFSLLDGLGSANAYAAKAKELNQEYIALTNHGNIDGLLKFQRACQKQGIKPILGCEAYIVNDLSVKEKGEKRNHVTLLIKNEKGFHNLCKLLTIANLEGFYYKPRIDIQALMNHCEGLIVLSGCSVGILSMPDCQEIIVSLQKKLKSDFYLEVMPHEFKDQKAVNKLACSLSGKHNIPLVATNDCHYVHADDPESHEVLLAMQTQAKWADKSRFRFSTRGLFLCSEKQMRHKFLKQGVLSLKQIDEAIHSTEAIASKCDFTIAKQNIFLPAVPLYKDKDPYKLLLTMTRRKLQELIKEYALDDKEKKIYQARLSEEWKLIQSKGFVAYFCIVKELVDFCKANDIMVGAGRGCFTGDTKVSLLDGTEKTFYELVEKFSNKEFWVYSCDKNGNIVPGKAKNPRMTKIARKICKIKLDNGEEISCTTDHKFLMRNGKYKEAKNLSINDSLMPLYRSYTDKGYEKHYSPKENAFILTHYMNFKYKRGFVIHHKDFNKRNNCLENLEQLSNKEHGDLHAQTNSDRWIDPDWRKEGIKRYWKTLGSKKNRNETAKRNKTEEHRKKVSKGQKKVWEDKNYKERMLAKLNNPEAIEKRKYCTLQTCNEIMNSAEGIQKTIERNKSKEHKEKVSAGRLKYFLTPEGIKEREKIRLRMKNRVVAIETRKKISNSRIGIPAWNKGISTGKGVPKTEETKRKISEALKGKSKSQEHKGKLSEARKNFLKREKIKNHKVTSILFVNETKEMYDIEVEKYHNFALSSGVFVHNSVGGSLVAFLLGITCVDPIKYNLLFSRFINEERQDLPDIDLDFEDNKREQVKEHLRELYGENNIASISTFLTMKGKAVVRDVARVFDVPLKEVDEFAKNISYYEEGDAIVAACKTDIGKRFAKKYPQVIKHAIKLEGTNKASGQHAAACIISADDLTKGTKGNLVLRKDQLVSNWDMEDSEHMGLMKLDVLGLNTLTVLHAFQKEILKNHNKEIDFIKLPLHSAKVYKQIAEGNNVGIFQISGWATNKLAPQIQADNIFGLSDLVALSRPGVSDSGMTDLYIERRQGNRWEKKHPVYEEITKHTYGIIVYQEQVMEMIYKIAGLPYTVADKIRKIIAKKRDIKEFQQYEDMFIEGCLKQGYFDKNEAMEFWETLQVFGGYLFNKSHSIAYAITAYWTAWARCYYPVEYICALLNYGSDNEKHKKEYIDEAKRLNLEIRLPSLMCSDPLKWKAKDGILYVPFIEIKGVGEKLIEKCAIPEAAQEQKGMTGFFQIKEKPKETTNKLKVILDKLTALEQEGNRPELQKYFSFNI